MNKKKKRPNKCASASANALASLRRLMTKTENIGIKIFVLLVAMTKLTIIYKQVMLM